MSVEIWMPAVGYEGIYEVSSQGRVRRILSGPGARSGLVLRPHVGHKGYLHVSLLGKTVRIHRIIAVTFLGPSDLPLVRHLDGNPANNTLENLAWGTHQDNTDDRVRHGRTTNADRPPATHCKRGHEFTPENTRYRAPRKSGHRESLRCRECNRIDCRRRYLRRKAQ